MGSGHDGRQGRRKGNIEDGAQAVMMMLRRVRRCNCVLLLLLLVLVVVVVVVVGGFKWLGSMWLGVKPVGRVQ